MYSRCNGGKLSCKKKNVYIVYLHSLVDVPFGVKILESILFLSMCIACAFAYYTGDINEWGTIIYLHVVMNKF